MLKKIINFSQMESYYELKLKEATAMQPPLLEENIEISL